MRERVRTSALLHRVRRIIEAIDIMRAVELLLLRWLSHLLKLILELFNVSEVLTLMPLLIAIGVLKQICVLVKVVLREHALRLDLVVVLTHVRGDTEVASGVELV